MLLQKENVQKIVKSEAIAIQMINDGWDKVEQEEVIRNPDEMTAKELQTYLKGKGIEFEKGAKKEELLALAKADDNDEGAE